MGPAEPTVTVSRRRETNAGSTAPRPMLTLGSIVKYPSYYLEIAFLVVLLLASAYLALVDRSPLTVVAMLLVFLSSVLGLYRVLTGRQAARHLPSDSEHSKPT